MNVALVYTFDVPDDATDTFDTHLRQVHTAITTILNLFDDLDVAATVTIGERAAQIARIAAYEDVR